MTENHQKKRISAWIHVVVCVIVGYLLSILFSRVNQFEEAQVRVAGRLIGPLVGQIAYGKGKRDEISLLLLGDKDINSLGAQWPIEYSVHADLLRTLASYKPKAVMIDILFLDRRKDTSVSELANTLCELRSHGIKVYLAALPNGEGVAEPWEVREELRRCATLVAVPKNEDFFDNQTWSYDLWAKERPDLPTVAMAMYRDTAGGGEIQRERFEYPVGLVWGAESDPENDRRQTGCGKLNVLSPLLHPLSSSLGEEDGTICSFHPIVSGAVLLRGEDEDYLRHALSGRYVIYGVSLTGASDVVKSPVLGSQPGSALHAMAIDNLLTLGEHYKKSLSPAVDNRSDVFVLLALTLIAIINVFLNRAYERRLSNPRAVWVARVVECLGWIGESRDEPTSKVQFLLGLIARASIAIVWLFPCGAVLAYVGYSWFDLAPMTWITFALFPILLEVEELTEKVMNFFSLKWC